MKDSINFGIGFITGRPNVCKIVNSYCKYLNEQVKDLDIDVNITVFILFDLGYQFTTRTDFYGILPESYKYVNIKYITPEEVDETIKVLMSQYNLKKSEAELLVGKGYGKARNAILYYALFNKMNYLLFWDDDEYPLAAVRNDDKITWKKQQTIKEHLKAINYSDITFGYRCGVMSPIPYIKYNNDFNEDDYKTFIEGISNEVISWEGVQKTRKKNGFLGYADEEIMNGPAKVISQKGKMPIIYGSNLCLNLDHLEKIPAFYNPPNARGEDTFFACATVQKETKVVAVPAYHFHDGFLKFTELMKGNYPNKPLTVELEDNSIEQRFYKATVGWIKYKPLYVYLTDKENYKKVIDNSLKCLEESAYKLSKQFATCNFESLITELKLYDRCVETHYKEYLEVNRIWDEVKFKLKEG